ncbi:MAG: hypothetical protein IJ275_04455 [Ruminococcus sp.]|nr:hypothetical protein [Ruminococcus sp.]
MKKKTIIIIVISIILVTAICFVRWYNGPTRAVEIFEDEIFEKDYRELVKMVEFMESLVDVQDAYIDSTDGTMLVHYKDDRIVKDAEISDEDVLSTVSVLMKKGYFNITKHGSTIYFERWRNQFGCSKGFVFSADGTGELDIQFLIGRMELDKTDWYYYVSDYEKWRAMN